MPVNNKTIALAFSISVIASFFVVSYAVYGHDGLPIGWDTPRYVGYTSKLSEVNVARFMEESGYYNVMYPIVSSVFTLMGFSPFTVEIFFPIVLCIFVVVISTFLTSSTLNDEEVTVYTILSCTPWFVLYRLGADLHSNLLALVFLLIASKYFLAALDDEKLITLKKIVFSALIFVSSFTHVETALFYVFIFLLTVVVLHILSPVKHNLKKTFVHISLILFSVSAGSFFYMEHLKHLLSYTQGILVHNLPLNLIQWIGYLGPLSFVGFTGLFLMLRDVFERKLIPEYFVFIISWALTSLVLASAHYFLQGLQIFSERALILFPTPFLAGLGFKKFWGKRGFGFPGAKRNYVVFVFLAILMYAYSGPIFQRVFISNSAYEKLTWISRQYKSETSPLFIFNDYDGYAGALGELYDNWVQAVYGDHYSYLGIPSFLLALDETPFVSLNSQQHSRRFLEELKEDGIFNMQSITDRKLIIIDDFFLPRPLPKYYRDFFDETHDGIFVFNATKWNQRNEVVIPLYCAPGSSIGWSASKSNWADSIYTLEFYDHNPSEVSYCEFLIPVSQPGDYFLTLRYWDGDGSNIVLELNGVTLGIIPYEGTLAPANYTVRTSFFSLGVHELRILLQFASGKSQYVSLDYLEIRLAETSYE